MVLTEKRKAKLYPKVKLYPTIYWGEPRCQTEHEGEHEVPQAETPEPES